MSNGAGRPVTTVIFVIGFLRALGFFLLVLGVAIAFLVMGHLAGRLIGVAMLIALALWVWRGLWPWLRDLARDLL